MIRWSCCGGRIYQIVAGYEDANDADRLRHDPTLQIVADQKLGEALGSQPTLSRWEKAPSARDLVRLNDALLDQFIRLCAKQVRQRGEILLDIESTDDPTHGQQQLSIFNGAYDQHKTYAPRSTNSLGKSTGNSGHPIGRPSCTSTGPSNEKNW
jgi:predicted secreted protein